MNPHYHPYGPGSELTSPHPPSPDNNNYHHHGPPQPAAHQHPGHPGNHPQHPMHGGPPSGGPGSNGGGNGVSNGHPHMLGGGGGPHGSEMPPHVHHQHPAFGGGGAPAPAGSGGHPHHHSLANNNNNNNNNNNSVKVCAGCGGKIVERFLLHALDRYWHNGCLKCSCCGAMLADIGSSCFTKSGMILCKQDYMRLFGNTGACSACGQTIPPSEFVMRTGVGQQPGAPPQHQVFHLKCFACSKCGAHLMPGDRYYMLAGSLVCEQDWHKLLKGSAAAGGTVRKGKVGRPRRSRD